MIILYVHFNSSQSYVIGIVYYFKCLENITIRFRSELVECNGNSSTGRDDPRAIGVVRVILWVIWRAECTGIAPQNGLAIYAIR